MVLPNALIAAKESASYFVNILKAPILPLYKKASILPEEPATALPSAATNSEKPSAASAALNLLSGGLLGSKVPDKIVFAKKVSTIGDFEAKLAMPFCADLRNFIQKYVKCCIQVTFV